MGSTVGPGWRQTTSTRETARVHNCHAIARLVSGDPPLLLRERDRARTILVLGVAVGPDVETERIDRYMRPEEDGIDWNERTLKSRLLRIVDATGVRWLEDPKVADTLHLTTDQRLEISDSATQLEALRDSVFGDLAQFLVAHQSDLDGAIVRERWHRAFEAELRCRFDVGAHAARLLTPEQLDWARIHLPAAGLAYSHDWLEREARAPLP